MPITFFTALWAALALLSLIGLYSFNKGKNIFVFITSQRYLIVLLVASLIGMRQNHILASVLLVGGVLWMALDYDFYLEKLKHIRDQS